MRFAFLALLMLATQSISAQQFPVDVAIRAELSAPLPWIIGTNYEIRLIVENLSNRDTLGLIRQRFLVPGLVDLYGSFTESCRRNADCEQFGERCYDTPVIPAFSTAQCVLGRQPVQRRGQDFFAKYTYQNLIGPHLDPDLTNNSVDVRITVIDRPLVQVPLSLLSYSLMGMLILGVGFLAARKV